MKLRKILICVAVLCFSLGLGLASATALADTPIENEPLRIEYCNLSFRDNVCVKYYVNTTDTNVKVLVWSNPQENYTYGTQDYSLETVGYKDIESERYLAYDYTSLTAKQMTDDVYAMAYNVVTDEYSELNRYSILQYAYNKLGKTGEKTTDTKLEKMLVSMLKYGANAQTYFGYKEDRLATDEFYQVKIVGGQINDGSVKGLYKTGETVTLTAPETDAKGKGFSGWENANGEKVGLTATYELTVGGKNDEYTATYYTYSQGLAYTSNGDGTCFVSGLGSCADTYVIIPEESPAGELVTGIGNNAFKSYKALTNVEIPNGVTYVGDGAFDYCNSLTNVTLPDSVKKIGERAFFYCTELTSVALGNGVTEIDDYAFNACDELTSVTQGSMLTRIGAYAFNGCTSLESINVSSKLTSLGSDAFKNCSALTSVVLPKGLTRIPARTFSGCRSLSNVVIGSGVTLIESSAFFGCRSLESITIPKSVKKIASGAFSSCERLTSVEFKNTSDWYVGKNSSYADGTPISLADATVNATNLTTTYLDYYWYNEQSLAYTSNGDGTCYVSGLGTCVDTDIVIPTTSPAGERVTSINSGAFYRCYSLTSVVIGNSVTSIGKEAFYRCYSLTSVVIGDSVTGIDERAFYDCDSLTSVVIGDSVTGIGNYAFYDCESLTSVVIGNSVTSIGNEAFNYCESLTSVVIGNSVTSIGSGAFKHCESLTSVVIGNSVTSIGLGAFSYCHKLIEVINKSALNITVGSDSCGKVGYYAKQVITDESQSRIIEQDGYVFYNDNGEYYLMGYKGTETDLELPNEVNGHEYSLYKYAFNYNQSITSVVIPDRVTYIVEGAFNNCESLTSVIIGNGVTSIGENTFGGCGALTSIVIPEGVTSIGNNAFDSCYQLVEVINKSALNITVGSDSYGKVGYYAKQVITDKSQTRIIEQDEYTFYNDNGEYFLVGYKGTETDLELPNDVNGHKYSLYQYAFNGNQFITSVVIPDGVTYIENFAFSGCASLNSVIIGNGVASTGYYTFSGCTSLTSVIIGNGVTSIGRNAFINCDSLTSVIIGNGVTSIGDRAFYDCDSLYSIIIPNSVTSIDDMAFENCDSLTIVVIGNGVTSIGFRAFYECYQLSIVLNKSALEIVPDSEEYGYAGLYAEQVLNNEDGISITEKDNYHFFKYNGEYYLFGYTGTDKELTLPNDIYGNSYSIYQRAFDGNLNITSVIIPNGVKGIGNEAFLECSSLTSVVIGNGVKGIGNEAFLGCSSLTSVVIGNGVTEIGDYAFGYCPKIKTLEVPSSLTYIGDYAFYCVSLESLGYYGTEEQWNAIDKAPDWNVIREIQQIKIRGVIVTLIPTPTE